MLPLRRPRHLRREDRPQPRVARQARHRRRFAPHQQCGRRHELRDVPHRPAPARLRPGQAHARRRRPRPHRRARRPRRREAHHARRPGARAHLRHGAHHRRRQDPHRPCRRHGRPGLRDRRHHRRRPARERRVQQRPHLAHEPQPAALLRGCHALRAHRRRRGLRLGRRRRRGAVRPGVRRQRGARRRGLLPGPQARRRAQAALRAPACHDGRPHHRRVRQELPRASGLQGVRLRRGPRVRRRGPDVPSRPHPRDRPVRGGRASVGRGQHRGHPAGCAQPHGRPHARAAP